MRFRFVGLVDVGALVVVLIAVVLPAREMYASAAPKGTAEQRFALALAEARAIAEPKDALAATALSHRLSEAGFHDWAVESAVRGSARAEGTPARWRILFAAAEAYVDQYEAEKGLDYAGRALGMCDVNAPNDTCPGWERVRMEMYAQQLDAGVKSGINPHKEPLKFRAAGERGLHGVRISGHEAELQPGTPQTPPPAPGSATPGSSAP